MSSHSADAAPQIIDDARALLAVTELKDIVYYAVSATRHGDANRAAIAGDTGSRTDQIEIEVAVRHLPTSIEVRCRGSVDVPEAQFVADAAAIFELSHQVEISAETMGEFVSKVGVMAVYPFLRESIFACASKLRVDPPVLALLRPGDMKITVEPDAT